MTTHKNIKAACFSFIVPVRYKHSISISNWPSWAWIWESLLLPKCINTYNFENIFSFLLMFALKLQSTESCKDRLSWLDKARLQLSKTAICNSQGIICLIGKQPTLNHRTHNGTVSVGINREACAGISLINNLQTLGPPVGRALTLVVYFSLKLLSNTVCYFTLPLGCVSRPVPTV